MQSTFNNWNSKVVILWIQLTDQSNINEQNTFLSNKINNIVHQLTIYQQLFYDEIKYPNTLTKLFFLPILADIRVYCVQNKNWEKLTNDHNSLSLYKSKTKMNIIFLCMIVDARRNTLGNIYRLKVITERNLSFPDQANLGFLKFIL